MRFEVDIWKRGNPVWEGEVEAEATGGAIHRAFKLAGLIGRRKAKGVHYRRVAGNTFHAQPTHPVGHGVSLGETYVVHVREVKAG